MGLERQAISLRCVPALLVVLMLVAGCGARSNDDLGSPQGTPGGAVASDMPEHTQAIEEVYVDDSGEKMFPDGTLEDWARWSSHVVRGTVVGEETRPDRSSDAGPYVMVGRDVTLEVTDVLWSNSNAIAQVRPGERITLYTYPGYLVHDDGTEQLAATDDGPRMEVGSDYVVAVMDDVVDGEQVLALMRPAAVEQGHSIIVKASSGSEPTAIPLHEVGSALEGAEVDSVVPQIGESVSQRWVRYMDLAD